MPFERPTLAVLVARIEADFVSRLETTGAPLLRRALVRVFARVLAGAVHVLYGLLVYLSRQLFPDLSDEDFLLRFAALFDIRPEPATYATGSVGIFGMDGTLIPSGTLLRRAADSAEFVTTEDATANTLGAGVPVRAALAGAAGNTPANVAMTLESPIAGVDSTGYVDEFGLSGGADQQSADIVRARLLQRLREPPQGGSDADYVAWALEVPGVTRAWVQRLGMGAGTVVVRFVRDGDASIAPDAGEVTTVAEYIEARRPSTASVYVLAPAVVPVNYSITLTPDSTEVRAAVTAELSDAVRGVGLGGTLYESDSLTALADGTKPFGAKFTLTAPAYDVTYAVNEIPVLGTITWG